MGKGWNTRGDKCGYIKDNLERWTTEWESCKEKGVWIECSFQLQNSQLIGRNDWGLLPTSRGPQSTM